MNAQAVHVIRVHVGARRRTVDRQKVKGLAESIGEIGLLNPITVREAGGEYTLVAGRHRLEAAKLLGWSQIPAVIVELDDVDRMLAEIDENLIRNELSDLERSEHLAERKRLYLLKHPETKRGGDRGNQHTGGRQSETVSFSQDTAEKTGRTERAVQQDVQIGESIPEDVRDAIRETPLADSKTDLMAMARLSEEDQRGIVAETDLTDKAAVRQAIADRKPPTTRAADPDVVQPMPDDDAALGFEPDASDMDAVADVGIVDEPPDQTYWEDEIMARQEAEHAEGDATDAAAGPTAALVSEDALGASADAPEGDQGAASGDRYEATLTVTWHEDDVPSSDQPGVADTADSAVASHGAEAVDAEAANPASMSAPPAAPAPTASPEQIQEIRSAEQRYWAGISAFLPLTRIDPAELVPLIPLDLHQEMSDTHRTIIAWLGNMGVALFQAKQRAMKQGAA